jgi:DNA-binding CsgD family transcriptional regulator
VVLKARGSATEADLPFAVLHQLLSPARRHMEQLAKPLRDALDGAFGLGAEPAPPDTMRLGLAVLRLLSCLADTGPLLIVVDDLHWVDSATCEVLAFVARRLEGEPIAFLAAARGLRLPARLDRILPKLTVAPLDEAGSASLLDRQDVPLSPGRRRTILDQAAGNPLALVELPRAVSRDAAGPAEAVAPLPVVRRLEEAFAEQAGALPTGTRLALLVAAAADGAGLGVIMAALTPGPGDPYDVWRPAEATGLVRLEAGRLEFRHPLVRSAVYETAPYSERRAVHGRLADVDPDPDRQAWHLAAATVVPDEEVAALVEAAAERARVRGAITEAVAGFERAGRLSPDPGEHGRRLGIAAVVAIVAGQVTRARDLAARAAKLTDDPVGRAWICELGGIASSMTMNLDNAFAQVLPAARELPPGNEMRFFLLSVAAHITYYSGRPDYREQLAQAFADAPAADGRNTPYREWVRWTVDPYGSAEAVRAFLPEATAALHGDPAEKHLVGALALRLDVTDTAIGLLDEIADPDREDSEVLQGGLAATDRAWAHFEGGRWTEARRAAEAIARAQDRTELPLASMCAHVLLATLAAHTGDEASARRYADMALEVVGAARVTYLIVRAEAARGMSALAAGDYETAYAALRPVFEEDGSPVHYHHSVYWVADLVFCAVRTGRADEAERILKRVSAAVGTGASPRLRRILHRAAAHLAPAHRAEEQFRPALDETLPCQWPFESAQARLEYGEWLRRRHRVLDARAHLTTALHTFERLGATPWAQRARDELRASGITVQAAGQDRLGALDGLPPRTQQILRLAAQGLTNPQIGDRLYLSPRTVASHLYRSFPKLGVTTRAQLRDVVRTGAAMSPGTGASQGPGPSLGTDAPPGPDEV